MVCSLCLDDDHGLADCPFFLFSANVVPFGNKAPEQQQAAKEQAKQQRQVDKEQYAKQAAKKATRDAKPKQKDKDGKDNKESHEPGDKEDDDQRGEKKEALQDNIETKAIARREEITKIDGRKGENAVSLKIGKNNNEESAKERQRAGSRKGSIS